MKTFKKAVVCFQSFTLLFLTLSVQGLPSMEVMDTTGFQVSEDESEYYIFYDRLETPETHKVVKLFPGFFPHTFSLTILNDGFSVFRGFISSFVPVNIYFITLSALAP